MDENKHLFQNYLRNQIHSYRKAHAFSLERMAEALHISPRSYIDQEHGKYGFSTMTFVHYILLLTDGEILSLFNDIRGLLGRKKKDAA